MDSDNEGDDFFSTLSAHKSVAEEVHGTGSNDDGLDPCGAEFGGQALQIGKKVSLRPSTNPTHDAKYWGKKTSRSKIHPNSIQDNFEKEEIQYSDADSGGNTDQEDPSDFDADSDDEQDWVSDDSGEEDDCRRPIKRRKVEDEFVDQSDNSFIDDDDDDEDDPSEVGNDSAKRQRVPPPKEAAEVVKGGWSFEGEAEGAKGVAVRKQLQLWEKCLQLRILIQKALHAANELPPSSPHHQSPPSLGDCGGGDSREEAKEAVESALQKVIEMCHVSMKALAFPHNSSHSSPSSSTTRRQSLSSGLSSGSSNEETLDEIDRVLLAQGSELMQKWSDKIQLSSGRFSDKSASFSSGGASNSIPQQIQSILADRNRLLKRTRTKRVDYVMASSSPRAEEKENTTATEVYDEYDFYQSLVKDLINSKSSSSASLPNASSGFGLQLKQVKSITTQLVRKNRNIVYDIHAKLVGFTAPEVLATDWKNEAIDSLTLSLFHD